VHTYDTSVARLGEAVLAYASERMKMDPVPLDMPKSFEQLTAEVGQTITRGGLGEKVLGIFTDQLAPTCISTDHPRYLSFIPCAPTEAALLFDLVVGASSIYGGSWMEGSGAIYAENQALRWIADLAGLPAEAGGVFVPGGTIGNLSALVAARNITRDRLRAAGGVMPNRWFIAASHEAHSSIASAADVMGVEVLDVETDSLGRLTGKHLAEALAGVAETDIVFAVVATTGTTNLGIVDEVSTVAEITRERGIWLHVDGAYGGAGLAAPSVRHLFAGVEWADSFIVDPHKWLFAPFDCCALIYRNPSLARGAHTQKAGYLDVLTGSDDFSPSDYAVGLTRRARGLPFWFSLATYGTAAYETAIEHTIAVARFAAGEIERRSYVELVRQPDLSVVGFTRIGWTAKEYQSWSDRLLAAQVALVLPSTHRGQTIARFAVVNPRTTTADITLILDTMA
jgi:L-2,4-diaminobutyrate decarboxylase